MAATMLRFMDKSNIKALVLKFYYLYKINRALAMDMNKIRTKKLVSLRTSYQHVAPGAVGDI